MMLCEARVETEVPPLEEGPLRRDEGALAVLADEAASGGHFRGEPVLSLGEDGTGCCWLWSPGSGGLNYDRAAVFEVKRLGAAMECGSGG